MVAAVNSLVATAAEKKLINVDKFNKKKREIHE